MMIFIENGTVFFKFCDVDTRFCGCGTGDEPEGFVVMCSNVCINECRIFLCVSTDENSNFRSEFGV